MTDLPNDIPNSDPRESEKNIAVPIERDANFVRISADAALVIDRGFGHELSFVVHGPDPETQFVDENGTLVSVSLQPSFTEVGRVRLTAPTALQMAMTVIEQSIERGRIEIEGFREAVNDMLDKKLVSDSKSENATHGDV